jgi:hypothetical protein
MNPIELGLKARREFSQIGAALVFLGGRPAGERERRD